MLTAEQLDEVPDPILDLFHEFENSVIQDIARRLATMDITETAAWQVQRLSESGMLYDDILARISQLTGKSEAVLRDLFEKAGVTAMAFDDAVYKAAGLNPLPLNLSPAMAQVLAGGLRKTKNTMHNLTMTTALKGQEAFVDAADLAYMQVSTGAMSYDQAIRAAIKKVAADGLSTISYGNHTDHLDVAVRRTVLTGVGQTVGELQMLRADEMGADLITTSAHIGARNHGEGPMNHEGWQGRIFSRSGTHSKYPDFVKSTGYGTVVGLAGINCRHSFYPFFEGISQAAYDQATLDDYASKTVTYNGQEISVYDATQKQRAIEREIRKAKREAGALQAAGLDNGEELGRVKGAQARMRDFVRQTGLSRQPVRESVIKPIPETELDQDLQKAHSKIL